MARQVMLTTRDNPFNPYEQFEQWYLYDIEKGYNTCERLERVAKIKDDYSEKEQDQAYEQAMDKIISLDIFDIFQKIVIETKENDRGEGSEN